MSSSSIDIRGLSVSYDGRTVVRGLFLELSTRAWVCLIGPNGSGKTSVLRAVAGLVSFTGEVDVFAKARGKLSGRELAKLVALVPQTPIIPPGMSVIDYVLLGRTPHIPYFGAESRFDLEIVGNVLERIEMMSLASRPLDSLSGGELQRAVLARALAQEAPILLLDEPTTGLDIGHQQQVLELVDALRTERNLTVLSAMHDLTLAAQFADELLLITEGVLVAQGSGASVLTEEALRQHYGASVRILEDPSGGVAVIPVREPVHEESARK